MTTQARTKHTKKEMEEKIPKTRGGETTSTTNRTNGEKETEKQRDIGERHAERQRTRTADHFACWEFSTELCADSAAATGTS